MAIMSLKEPPRWLGLGLPAWGSVVVAGMALGALLHFLVHLGPRPVDLPEQTAAMTAEQWRVSLQIDEIEQRYGRLPDGAAIPSQSEADLVRAVAWQEQLLRVRPGDASQVQRLERLLTVRDTLRARLLWPQIEAVERTLRGELPPAGRVAAMEQALSMRRGINHSHAVARYKNIVRVTQLERDLESAQAQPLSARATAEVAQARAAADQQQWTEALEHYTRAREVLDELNLKYSRTRQADLGLQARVRAEEAALQGASDAAEIDVLERGGDAAAAAGRPDEAVALYQDAVTRQTELNRRWPRSRFVSTARLDRLEEKRQTVLSGKVLEAMREEDRTVEALLAQRQTLVAATHIAVVRQLADQLAGEFARSRQSDEGLARKYAYLNTLNGHLRGLQDDVYDRLLPLPNTAHRMLLRSEVGQDLYARIMKINPSRQARPEAPVDSVTWGEAMEFCRRLSWVLGQPVRLPTAAEFRQALQAAPLTGAGEPEPGGDPGFQHLLGGMAEWLAAEADSAAAAVAPAGELSTGQGEAVDFAIRPKDMRDRNLGFRVLVETTAF